MRWVFNVCHCFLVFVFFCKGNINLFDYYLSWWKWNNSKIKLNGQSQWDKRMIKKREDDRWRPMRIDNTLERDDKMFTQIIIMMMKSRTMLMMINNHVMYIIIYHWLAWRPSWLGFAFFLGNSYSQVKYPLNWYEFVMSQNKSFVLE